VIISLELHGQLLPDQPRKKSLQLESGSRVQDAVDLLGIDPETIGLITINGVQSEMQDTLAPDCRLCLFPYLSGG
jgi:hypothetical protein